MDTTDPCPRCKRPIATPGDAARHDREDPEECQDPWTHWCQKLCWCSDIHHTLQEPGWCDVCHPKITVPRPKNALEALIDAASGVREEDYE